MLFDNLSTIAARAPSSSGLRVDGRLQEYPELTERAGRLGSGLAARGIAEGDAVAILLPNGPDLFVVAYALFAIGAIAVPLSIVAPRHELASAAKKAGIAGIVTRADLAAAARQLAVDLAPQTVTVFGDGEGRSMAELERYPLARLPKLGADVNALYLFSSGSTGLPKVVPHTHGEMLGQCSRHPGRAFPDPRRRGLQQSAGQPRHGVLQQRVRGA